MKDGGGPVIERAKVVLIFRGPGWMDGLPTSADVTKAFSAIVASPYLSRLVQYRGIRRPRVVDTISDVTEIGHRGPDPRKFLTTEVLLIDKEGDKGIIQAVKDARKKGPHEPLGGDALYLVVVSGDPLPVFSQPEYNNAAGFHEQYQDDDGMTVTYGVILNWSKNTADNIWN